MAVVVLNSPSFAETEMHSPLFSDYSDVDCGDLLPPMNGVVIFNETAFASEAMYVCNEGFELNGSSVRICQSDNEWSESEPTCKGEATKCFCTSHITHKLDCGLQGKDVLMRTTGCLEP